MSPPLTLLTASLSFFTAASPFPPNGLAHETSPYLQEHARDPVRWLPWGKEALAKARREKKAVFLSIGRAGCRECRTRERQAFEDPQTASVLEPLFVCVKVDADERPDVEDIYATATDILGGGKGSTLAVFLFPDGRPFLGQAEVFSGRAGGSDLKALALRAGAGFRNNRAAMEATAAKALDALRQAQRPEAPRGPLTREVVASAVRGLAESYDPALGRFGPGPPHAALRLLLEEQGRTDQPETLALATRGLDRLARAPLLDLKGGAFFRERATDRTPSPVKTLVDNALFLRAYAQAHAATGSPRYREVAEGITVWAAGRMRDPGGGFRAFTDEADGISDDRVFAGANGLMIGALALSGSALGRKEDLEAARRAAISIRDRLGSAATLKRYALGGDARGSAFLEDYAYLAEGLLDLHEATGEEHWRVEAEALVSTALTRFVDVSGGGFFTTDASHEPLLVRLKDGYDDGDSPSPNGVVAAVLWRLGQLTGEARYEELARRTVEAFLGELQRAPRGMETLASVASNLTADKAAPSRSEPPRPSREVRGPVTLQASLSADRVHPGDALEARVGLRIAPGWRVVARGERAKGLFPLAVSVTGADFIPGPPHYPPGGMLAGSAGGEAILAYRDEAVIVLPVRVNPRARPGEIPLRLLVRFQACAARDCQAPEGVVLQIALGVTDPSP